MFHRMAASLLHAVRNVWMNKSHARFGEGIRARGSFKIGSAARNAAPSGAKDSSINFSAVRSEERSVG